MHQATTAYVRRSPKSWLGKMSSHNAFMAQREMIAQKARDGEIIPKTWLESLKGDMKSYTMLHCVSVESLGFFKALGVS